MKQHEQVISNAITRYNGSKSIVKVTPRDYPMILEWYAARGKPAPSTASFSDLGYIVDGRVVGWLYLTNSNMAMIEGIVSDPSTIPSLRKASTRKLVGFLIDAAVALGYTNLFGISKHPSILGIAKQFGFKEDDSFKVVTLNTEDEE